MRPFVFLLLLINSLKLSAQPWHHLDKSPETDSLCLFFFGDIMQHDPQISGAWDSNLHDYNYRPCFQYIAPYWQKADYVIANLETTLTDKGYSGYPQFSAPWQLVRDLKSCGVDILTTTNNHSCDKGHIGIRKTLYYLDSLKISHTGTYLDTNSWISQTPFYIRHGRFKIALISCTYGTNGIAVTHGQVVSMIDTFHIHRQIEKALLDTATNIIAIMHWGEEYHTTPHPEQERLATWLHTQGADIVIGSHPHVVQPIRYIHQGDDTTGITVFSLGNFVSNQSKRYTNGGIGIYLTLYRQSGRSRYRMQYLSSYVYRPIENGKRRYYVIPEPEASTLLHQQDSLLYTEFFHDTDSIIRGVAPKFRLEGKEKPQTEKYFPSTSILIH